MSRDLGAGEVARGGGSTGARALERLRAVGRAPRAEARAVKERTGTPLVAYFDPYLPEELIMAHGLLPFRVPADGSDEVYATEHIQSYACPVARNLLDQALRGDLEFVDGALFTRYCDSLRGVFAVWDTEHLSPFVDLVRYPTVTVTEAAVTYLAAELREVSERMGEALGTGADERRLREAMAACDRKRALVAQLAARRADRTLPLLGADFLAILIAATTMLPDDFTQELSALLAHPPAGEPGDAVPAVLSGTTFDNVALAAAIESTGFWLAGEDLASGSRWWTVQTGAGAGTLGAGDDPWTALARAYLTKPPCSVKEPSAPRADHLLAQVAATRAEAVIVYLSRFCESEEVEWPFLRDRLDRAGIPVLLLEGEQRIAGFEQTRTRLEAFRERLEGELS